MSLPEAPITRIARRKAFPGHAGDYERLVREMFGLMQRYNGFLGAELIPPETKAGEHQVIVKFASEEALAAWDASADRRNIFAQMQHHAEGTPQHRRLDVMEEWFVGPEVPAAARPPRWKTAVVTWLGIWPLVSLSSYFVAPWLLELGLPFLIVTAVNVAVMVTLMVYLVAPTLTRLLRGFLVPRSGA